MAEVSRLPWLLTPNGALVAPAEEQNVASFVDTNVPKRTQTHKESVAEKVKTGAAETGEGSGEKKKAMICGELEMSVLA